LGAESGVGAGPLLMLNRACLVDVDDNNNKDSPQWLKWQTYPEIGPWWMDKTMRQVLATDEHGKILVISVHASVPGLCEILKSKGVVSALNLDGGRSTATMVNKPHNQENVDGGRLKLAIVNTPHEQNDDLECKVEWKDLNNGNKCGRPILTAIVVVSK
jgi:hypothetical protein